MRTAKCAPLVSLWKQVSGRVWKAPARRAGEVMKPQVGTSWEKKTQLRASRKQFLDFKKEAAEAAKEKRKVHTRACLIACVHACVCARARMCARVCMFACKRKCICLALAHLSHPQWWLTCTGWSYLHVLGR